MLTIRIIGHNDFTNLSLEKFINKNNPGGKFTIQRHYFDPSRTESVTDWVTDILKTQLVEIVLLESNLGTPSGTKDVFNNFPFKNYYPQRKFILFTGTPYEEIFLWVVGTKLIDGDVVVGAINKEKPEQIQEILKTDKMKKWILEFGQVSWW